MPLINDEKKFMCYKTETVSLPSPILSKEVLRIWVAEIAVILHAQTTIPS